MSDLRHKVLRYVSRQSRTIPGYLQPGALALVWSILETQIEIGVRGNVAEIGVYEGKLYALMALGLRQDEKAFGFDVFSFGQSSPESNLSRVKQRMADLGFQESQFELCLCNSRRLTERQLAEKLDNLKVRIFSVDGDHSRDGAFYDLQLASAVMQERGVIIADDLYNAWYPGVTDAIYEFVGSQEDWVPFAISATHGLLNTGCSKLFMCHHRYQRLYRSYLRVLNRANYRCTDDFRRYPVDIYDFHRGVVQGQIDEETRREIRLLVDASKSSEAGYGYDTKTE